MGWGIVAVFWFVAFSIFMLIFSPILWYGIKKKSRILKIIGGMPIWVLCLVILWAIVTISLPLSSKWVFKQAFGFSADSKVKILRHDHSGPGEFIVICLKFETDKETLEKILQGKFNLSKHDVYEKVLISGLHKPSWFTPPADKDTKCYYASPFYDKLLVRSEAWLSYNEKDGIVFFCCVILD